MDDIQRDLDIVKVIEKYLILLLGAVDRPISTQVHLQKEFFILSKTIPKISEYVVFEKHYKGPYSNDLKEVSNEPVYLSDCFTHDFDGFYLTDKGKDYYNKFVEFNTNDGKFIEFLAIVRMIRELYDKLSEEELLFLIYITYDEYTEYSAVSDKLLSPNKKKYLANKLLKKGAITESRYKELMGDS